MSTKAFSLLLLAALAAAHFPDQQASPFKNRKIQVGAPQNLNVAQPAAVAIPLALVAADYQGPYDPIDPDGVMAATRRRSVLEGQAAAQAVKSYIPPGALEAFKKDVVKLVVGEAGRFALAHPKEAAELVAIFNKAMALIGSTTHRIKDLEKKGKI